MVTWRRSFHWDPWKKVGSGETGKEVAFKYLYSYSAFCGIFQWHTLSRNPI